MDSRFIHLFIAQILTVLVGLSPYLIRRSRIAYYFAGAHVSLALWCLNECVVYLPVSHSTRVVIFRLSYMIGVCMVWYFFHFLFGMAEIPVTRFKKGWLVTKAGGFVCLLLTFTPWLTIDIREFAHPFQEIPGVAYPIFIAFMLYGLGLPLYQLGRAYQHTHGHTRTQLKYLFFASCFAFLEGLIFFSSLYLPRISHYYFYLQVLYALLLAYAIIAHHLMDITVIIRKTLEYSLITAILAGIYIGIITLGTYFIERWTGFSSTYTSALAAAAIALLFQPLRLATQTWIDKRFSRQRINTEETLDVFSGHLAGGLSANDVARALLEVLGSLRLKVMGLYLRTPDGRQFEGYRSPPDSLLPPRIMVEDPWVGALVLHGMAPPVLPASAREWGITALFPMKGPTGLVGILLVGEKLSEQELDESDHRLIESVLQQSAMAYEQIIFFPETSESLRPETLADVARGFVHEIKTPLANINLPAQATMNDLAALEQGKRSAEVLLPKFKERMKFIMTQALKASERIDAIRQFAAVEDSRLEPVDLSVVVNESISSLEGLLEKVGVRVHTQSPDGPAMVRANPKQLEIVFVNLIKNAAEAMDDKTIPVQDRHLWLKIWREDRFHLVEVKDSGTGIQPDNLSHVSERYFTTKGASGTGVGLYFARQLLSALDGSIGIASEPNHGAVFTVRLPVLEPQHATRAFRS